ncbi:uncharacterized protein LOC144716785 isoform X1 [Wolffia australiana]
MVFVARNSPKSSHDHSWHQKSSREGTKPTRDKALRVTTRREKNVEREIIQILQDADPKSYERKRSEWGIIFFVIFGFKMLIEFNWILKTGIKRLYEREQKTEERK